MPWPLPVKTCLHGTATCTPGGLILVPFSCNRINTLQVARDSLKTAFLLHSFSIYAAEAYLLNEATDFTKEPIHHLTSDIHYVEYEIKSSLADIVYVIGHLFPHEDLSYLLGRPADAITSGDLMVELATTPVNANVLHDLRYKGTYSV